MRGRRGRPPKVEKLKASELGEIVAEKPNFQVVGEALLTAGNTGLMASEISEQTSLSQGQVTRVLHQFEKASLVYSLGQRGDQSIWCIVSGTDVTKPPRPVRGAKEVRRRHRSRKRETDGLKGGTGIAEAIWRRFLSLGPTGAIPDEIIVWAKRNPKYAHINYTTITARINALKYSGLLVQHPENAERRTRSDRLAIVLIGVDGDFRALYKEPLPKNSLEADPQLLAEPVRTGHPGGWRRSAESNAVLDAAKTWVGEHQGGDPSTALEALLAAAWTAYGEEGRPGAADSKTEPRTENGAEDGHAVLGR